MLRPNGSVIGRFSATGELNAASVIQYALSRRQQPSGVWRKVPSKDNLCTMYSAYNPRPSLVRCTQSAQISANQRVGAAGGADGSGNAESAGAAEVPFGAFGFLGFSILRAALGGGPAGWSSATTGFGSMLVEAGVVKSPGTWMTCTGMVAGWNLFSV